MAFSGVVYLPDCGRYKGNGTGIVILPACDIIKQRFRLRMGTA